MVQQAIGAGAHEAIPEAIASLSAPVFCATVETPTGVVTLHAPNPRRRALKREAEAALSRAGIAARCRVRPLRYRRMAKAGSLQDILAEFGGGKTIYDPTASVGRAQALIALGGALRAALGETLAAIYYDTAGRTLYVRVPAASVARDGRADGNRQRAIQDTAGKAISDWRMNELHAFDLAVRLCVTPPRMPLLALDRASLAATPKRRAAWATIVHSGLLAGGVAALFGFASTGPALADGPAVSAPNAKGAIAGGTGNGDAIVVGEGSVTVPLGTSFGAQFDASAGSNDGRFIWGLGGQAFWRDPQKGMVGGFITHLDRRIDPVFGQHSVAMNRFGAEGEAYLGQFTVGAMGGVQTGDRLEDGRHRRGGFGQLDLTWYPVDNFALDAGGEISPGKDQVLFGAEYQLGMQALPGLAIFTEDGIRTNHISGVSRVDHALVGIRYYFGAPKSLIRRHREDDPKSVAGARQLQATWPGHNQYGGY